MFAATCARRSPAVSCFERICARRRRKTSSTICAAADDPDRRDDDALLEDLAERADRRGRAAADVHVVREVGDVAEQLAVVVDGRDQADVVQVDAARVRVVRDDHVARAEPLRRRSGGSRAGSARTIEPRCTGCAKPCAIGRSRASKNAQEKSERVLMFVEYALRLSARTISSVAATSAFRITSKEIGSTAAHVRRRPERRASRPRRRPRPRRSRRGRRRARARGSPSPRARRAAPAPGRAPSGGP